MVVAVVACVAGCTGAGGSTVAAPAGARVDEAVAVGAVGESGGRVSVPGGPMVDVPAGSVSGSGELVVTRAGRVPAAPSPYLSVLGAYRLELRGARLTGPVRLTFPVLVQPLPERADDAAAAVLGRFDETAGRWKLVAAEHDPGKHTISAEVSQLTWWNAFSWDFAALRNAVADDYRRSLAVSAPTPVCPGEQAARQSGIRVVALSGAAGERVRWCYGVDAGVPVLKVTNARGYPVTVRFPGAWRSGEPAGGVELAPGLSDVRRSGSSASLLLTGGATVDLRPTVLEPGGEVTARPSADGFLAMALTFGLKAFGSATQGVPGAAGPGKRSPEEVLEAVREGDCLDDYDEGDPADLDAAVESVLEAHETAFGCLQKVWPEPDRAGGRGGRFTGVALTWLTAGIPVLIDGVTGVADEAVFTPVQTIRVQAVEPRSALLPQ
ncbi:hypothetical protein [Kineosporia succinea]|uniref:Uncharacterized protein n=1 Tax=Kineosporia succinea TaxID=84632 RepID=A0ABT9NXD9_9ACTN|nr:hypothetical protein [Kineosporia succinea]MDP9825098.1 hypothetical protein [Kineosporia succinea]